MNAFVAHCTDLVLYSLCHRKPVKGVEKRRDVFRLFLFEDKSGSVVLNSLQRMDRVFREAKEKSVTVVQAGKDEGGDQFGCGISCEEFANGGYTTELEVAGADSGRNKFVHG